MDRLPILEISADYCGTSYAARLLGLSVGTIHTLVDKKEIDAWKTNGGHRRISIASIRNYQLRNNLPLTHIQKGKNKPMRITVIDDDEATRFMLTTYLSKLDIKPEVIAYHSAIEALLDLSNWQPHIILTDLLMPQMDGFEFLNTIHKHMAYRNTIIIVMSGLSLSEIHERGGLPDGALYMQKPISMERLQGFMDSFSLSMSSLG